MAKKEIQQELLTKEDREFLIQCLNATKISGTAAEVSQIVQRIASLQQKLKDG